MRLTSVAIIVTLALAVLLLPHASEAQQPKRPYRIGVLHDAYVPGIPQVQGLKAGLKALGLEEGRDLTFDIHFTRGSFEATSAGAADLVKAGMDLIFAIQEQPAQAAKSATSTIPSVFVDVGDPVAAGIVKEIANPGGNITGVSGLVTELVPKRLEILKALFPSLRRVWAVYHVEDLSAAAAARKAQEVAPLLKLEVITRPVRTSEELVSNLKALRAGDGLLPPPTHTLDIRGLTLDLHLSGRVPAIFNNSFWVQAGAVASYGSEIYAEGVQAARLAAKILRGARPRDLPVEGANKIELAINLKTAKALGVTIPREILARADQVIE